MNKYKKNYSVYFSFYFVLQMLLVVIHVYLPIFLFNILNVNRRDLAFIQIFAYSAYFIKPILAIYFDKKGTASKRKIIILLCSFGVSASYILFVFNLANLIVFGIFLGIILAMTSTIDVCIDKTILENSPTEKIKSKNTLVVRLGVMMGVLFPVLIFLILSSFYDNIEIWTLFFFICFFAVIPILFIAPFITTEGELQDSINDVKENEIIERIYIKSILFMCIFMFFFYALRLYEYPFEPWALDKYFYGNYLYFSIWMLLMVIMNVLGIVIAGLLSHKYDRKKVLFFSAFFYGVLTIITPFMNLIFFWLFTSVIQFLAGFVMVNSFLLVINISKKKVMFFQIIMSFAILANVVFIPLGTYLSSYIRTEFIIVLAGILILFSIIPLYFLDEPTRKDNNT